MKVLVVTTVHHPEDSRIRARQIQAMLDAGWSVTYAAPFSGYGMALSAEPGLSTVDLPRSVGRRRAGAYRAARSLIRDEGPQHDVVLLHDPELILAVRGLPVGNVVWDVHEDTAATLASKSWLPGWSKQVAAQQVRRTEQWAEDNLELILAEHSYQARFRHSHLVVPNSVRVPTRVSAPGDDRVVYVGSLTTVRGARDLIRVGQMLTERTDGEVQLRLIGGADVEIEPYLRIAAESGALRWDGFLPSHEAMAALDGALAGLSLLHPTPNYLISMPTKVLEYMAHGVPVVTTPLPLVTELVESAGAGLVVPYRDPAAVADAILSLRADRSLRTRLATAGRSVARWQFDWEVQAASFLSELVRVAQKHRSGRR